MSKLSSKTVILNSRVTLRHLESGATEEWILTKPEYANPDEFRISARSPVGSAMYGHAEGDVIEWDCPGGRQKARIESVRPETFTANPIAHLIYG